MAKNKPSHLLVIRLSAMGDVAMTVPILIALTRKYPELKLTVLTRAFFAPMFSNIPNVSVYSADVKGRHKGILGLWKLSRELKKLNIDAVADLHNVLRSTILIQFFGLSGIPFVQLDKGRAEKKALTREKNKILEPLKTTHQRYVDVFNTVGFPISLETEHTLKKEVLFKDVEQTLGLTDKKYIGVAPFAAFDSKMYPLELMEKVIYGLQDLEGYQILLFGGGDREKTHLSQWEEKFENCINVVGKVSFSEELALISNLDLMLSMDSGNGHLAAMYSVPTITLWGVTHPYAGFYPFGQKANTIVSDRIKFPNIPTSVYGNKFPSGYEKAMETIAPEQILEKVLETLKEKL